MGRGAGSLCWQFVSTLSKVGHEIQHAQQMLQSVDLMPAVPMLKCYREHLSWTAEQFDLCPQCERGVLLMMMWADEIQLLFRSWLH